MATTIQSIPRLLPAGRYWITIPQDDQLGTWQGWLDAFKDNVHVENTSSRDAEYGAPAWDFYIFTTNKDLIWERGDYPTKAAPNIQSVQDTVQRPPPEQDITDVLHDKLSVPSLLSGVGTLATVAVAAVIGILAIKMLQRKR